MMVKQMSQWPDLNDALQRQPPAPASLRESSCYAEANPLPGLILEQLRETLQYNSSIIMLLGEGSLRPLLVRGQRPREAVSEWPLPLEEESRLYHEVVRRRKPLILADVTDNTPLTVEFQRLAGRDSQCLSLYGRAWLIIPLVSRERMIGVLALAHCQTGYYTLYHAWQALPFSRQMAVALEHQQLYEQLYHLAIVQERGRLAREMHDQLAQALGYINLKSSAIGELLVKGEVGEAQSGVQELKQVAQEAYAEVRGEIFNLRTRLSSEVGFFQTLGNYLAEYNQQAEIEVSLSLPDAALAEFSMTVGTQLLRIIQEALSNVRKHSSASQVLIAFKLEADHLCLCIEDDGQGFELEQRKEDSKHSFGLQIMRERAESVGAELKIASAPGQSTKIVVALPLLKK